VDIPDQSGRTAVITGANSGIGYCTARELARHGAEVLLACRSEQRGEEALERLHAEVPGGRVRLARVVSVSSIVHAVPKIDFSDLKGERRYRRRLAYSRSKAANLLFIHELARRLKAAGADMVAAAAHPGYAATNLQTRAAKIEGNRRTERFMTLGNRLLAQSAEAGALPSLYAATAPGVEPDSFTGPALVGRGAPAPSWRASWTRDDRAAELLWTASEQLTGSDTRSFDESFRCGPAGTPSPGRLGRARGAPDVFDRAAGLDHSDAGATRPSDSTEPTRQGSRPRFLRPPEGTSA
jgi:NAD(P)-dependent dehydrogenase (short-subunit alcohol dehydrogenase family)